MASEIPFQNWSVEFKSWINNFGWEESESNNNKGIHSNADVDDMNSMEQYI